MLPVSYISDVNDVLLVRYISDVVSHISDVGKCVTSEAYFRC